MTSPSFEIVVSAENHSYNGWQALLWHHVALVWLGRAPLVVVHGEEPDLAEPYRDLIAHGGRVQRAPNYRTVNGVSYAARNTAATLLHVQTDADYLVICDPDILIAGPWPLEQYALSPNPASLDSVAYLVIDDEARTWLAPACRRAGLPLGKIRRFRAAGGVPHIVPRGLQHELGAAWLRLHDTFHPLDGPNPEQDASQLPWLSLASMWSFLMALHQLGIEPVVTRFCMTNYQGALDPREDGFPDRPLLHYCYGDATFDKRSYEADRGGRGSVWNVRAPAGTINGLIASALRAAGEFYGYRKRTRASGQASPARTVAQARPRVASSPARKPSQPAGKSATRSQQAATRKETRRRRKPD